MSSKGTWKPLPEGWAELPFSGELPATLYRYRSLSEQWVEKYMNFELVEEGIFLAGAHTLNDPDEGRIHWIVNGSFEAAVKLVMETLVAQNSGISPVDLLPKAWETARAMISGMNIPQHSLDQMNEIVGKSLRIACFTTRPLNGPMWTHYGHFSDISGQSTPHGGLCIEYKVDESWRKAGLWPIDYAEKRPEINMLERDNLKANFARASRVKSPDWAYEDEWRLVAYLEAKPPWPDNLTVNSKIQLEGSIRSVIFGLNTRSDVIKKIMDILQKEKPQIVLKKVIRDKRTAALKIVPFIIL